MEPTKKFMQNLSSAPENSEISVEMQTTSLADVKESIDQLVQEQKKANQLLTNILRQVRLQ